MALRLAQRHLDGRRRRRGRTDRPDRRRARHRRRRAAPDRARPAPEQPRRRPPGRARRPHPARADPGRRSHVQPEPLPDDVATTVVLRRQRGDRERRQARRGDAHRRARSTRRNGHVEVRVADDGCGGAAVGAGSGLAGLSDRVSAVGGSLALESDARRAAPSSRRWCRARRDRRGLGALPRRARPPARRRRPRDRRQGRRRAVARGRRARARSPTSRSSTSACRPTTPTTARAPPGDLRAAYPTARHPPPLAAHRDASLGRARQPAAASATC